MYTIPTITAVAAMPRAELIRQLVAKGRYTIHELLECCDGVLCVCGICCMPHPLRYSCPFCANSRG